MRLQMKLRHVQTVPKSFCHWLLYIGATPWPSYVIHLVPHVAQPFLFCMLQEVYDWAGAIESFPLYFTLHRGGVLVSHAETIEQDETLNVTERVSRQWDLLNFQVDIFVIFDSHNTKWN